MLNIYHFKEKVCSVPNHKEDVMLAIQKHHNRISKDDSIVITDIKHYANGWLNVSAISRDNSTKERKRNIKSYKIIT